MTNLTVPEVECMIEDYLEKHPGPNYASEIAYALGLELDITFETINKLLEEGRIKKSKRKPPQHGPFCENNSPREVI